MAQGAVNWGLGADGRTPYGAQRVRSAGGGAGSMGLCARCRDLSDLS